MLAAGGLFLLGGGLTAAGMLWSGAVRHRHPAC